MASPRSGSGFAGFTCWTPTRVQDAIPPDAVSPADAVFIATHQPCHIVKRPIGATSGGQRVFEKDVVSAFLRPGLDQLLLPIIGHSGTGKSHLIRWMRANVPEDPRWRTVYIPKYGTTLRGVIDLILERMEGDDVLKLRKSLKDAVDDLSQDEAPTALLDALARTLEFRSSPDHRAGLDPVPEDRKWIAENLPVLLRDTVFRKHLLRSGGVIEGFVNKVLHGTQPGDSGEGFAFSIADLPITPPDLNRASKDAVAVNDQLSGDLALRGLAAEMLTEQLGPAVQEVFGLSGSVSLTDIMRQTREALQARKQELLIFIEDFTVLQGIQRPLLDALIEPATRAGVQVLCPIRVAMAVTSGYFNDLEDTIRTRAAFAADVYVLDIPYGAKAGWTPKSMVSFVGRYLNASRLDKDEIERQVNADGHPQNACTPCQFKAVCHESFGTSEEGYGLYPFNAAALDRAVRATVSDYFDPRAVLGAVLRFTLDAQRTAIQSGKFPGTAFGAKYQEGSRSLKQLSIPVREQLSRLPDPQRRTTMLTFWGDCPDAVVNLQPGIHEAFQISMLDVKTIQAVDITQTTEDDVKPPPVADAYPPAVTRQLAALESWASGASEMLQDLTRDIRSFLFESVWSRLEWSDLFMHPSHSESQAAIKSVFNEFSFQIEGTPTRRGSFATVTFQLGRDPQLAALFRGITIARHIGSWNFADGDRLSRMLSNQVSEWADVVSEAVEAWRFGTKDQPGVIEARLAALAISARILGIEGGDSDEAPKWLAASLAPGPGVPADVEVERGWSRIVMAAAEKRATIRTELLAVVAGRQGASGDPRVIDPTVLLPIMSRITKRGQLLEPPAGDTGTAMYVRKLDEALRTQLANERRNLEADREQLDKYLPPNIQAKEVADALLFAASAAADANVFVPAHELEAFQRECQLFKTVALAGVREALRAVLEADWDARLGRSLVLLQRSNREALRRIVDFCKVADTRLDQTQRRAAGRLGGAEGNGGGKELYAVLDQVIAALGAGASQ